MVDLAREAPREERRHRHIRRVNPLSFSRVPWVLWLEVMLLWLWLVLLEGMLLALALFGILLGEVWQARVREAKKVCAIEGCVWLFLEIKLLWKGIGGLPFEGRYQGLVL